jgi:hypothetical protein
MTTAATATSVRLSDQRRNPPTGSERCPRWMHRRGRVWYIAITCHCGGLKERFVVSLGRDHQYAFAVRNAFVWHVESGRFPDFAAARAWLKRESTPARLSP